MPLALLKLKRITTKFSNCKRNKQEKRKPRTGDAKAVNLDFTWSEYKWNISKKLIQNVTAILIKSKQFYSKANKQQITAHWLFSICKNFMSKKPPCKIHFINKIYFGLILVHRTHLYSQKKKKKQAIPNGISH